MVTTDIFQFVLVITLLYRVEKCVSGKNLLMIKMSLFCLIKLFRMIFYSFQMLKTKKYEKHYQNNRCYFSYFWCNVQNFEVSALR